MGRAFRTAEQKAAHLGNALGKMRLAKSAAGDVLKYGKILERLKAKQAGLGVFHRGPQSRRIAPDGAALQGSQGSPPDVTVSVSGMSPGRSGYFRFKIKQDRTEHGPGWDRRQRNKAVRGELKGQAMGDARRGLCHLPPPLKKRWMSSSRRSVLRNGFEY